MAPTPAEISALHSTLVALMPPWVRPTPDAGWLAAHPYVRYLVRTLRRVIICNPHGAVVSSIDHMPADPRVTWDGLHECHVVDLARIPSVTHVHHLGTYLAALIVVV